MSQNAVMKPSREERPPLTALLAEAIDRVAEVGPQCRHHGTKLTELSARFCQGRFHLAVLGQFKRGKSTLLNALIGEPILPVGVVPLTAVPTFIQFAPAARITIQSQAGDTADTFTGTSTSESRDYLAGYVTEKGNPRNRRGIGEVQVEVPAPILSGGVVLIDTPGIGSTYRHNTTATMNFLQQCDAALFLVSADPPITETELTFLQQVKQKVPRLFFVLNKIDYLDESERREALSFFQNVLEEEIGWKSEFPVFSVSARQGTAAKTAADPNAWAASGMAQLESFLVDFLAKEKFNALADAVGRRALDLIEAVLMEAGIALQALKLPRQELEEKIGLFAQSLKRSGSERNLIQDILAGDKKRITAFIEEEAGELRREAEQFLREIMKHGPGTYRSGRAAKNSIQQAWSEAIPDFFEEKRQELNARVQARLLECLTPHEERLDHLVESLRRTAADLFQVPYRPLCREDLLEIKSRPYWVLNAWNTDPLPILQSMDQRLDGLVRRNVENIRWSMLQNLNISLAGFARRTRERLDETVEATKGAMEAAKNRRQAHDGSIATEVARMEGCIESLKQLQNRIAAFNAPL